jgi:hypothetical protein
MGDTKVAASERQAMPTAWVPPPHGAFDQHAQARSALPTAAAAALLAQAGRLRAGVFARVGIGVFKATVSSRA